MDFALSLPSAASQQILPAAGNGSGMTWQKSSASRGSASSESEAVLLKYFETFKEEV